MSARFLTAYLVSVGLAAGIISQALAKPPDLPAKVQINCEKCCDKLVLKTYQVADLVIPVESAAWPDQVCPSPVPVEGKWAHGTEPEPASVLAPPPEMIPQPFGFVTLPAPPPAPYFPVPIPLMRTPVFGLAKSSPTQAPKACCPACTSANCNGCGSDALCQAPACVAAGCASVQVRTPQKTLEDRLIRLIVSTVKPESWDVNGGRGTIDYFPLGMALTVNQTPEIQEQVAQLLAALRRLQDEQIAVEVRVISVPQGFGEKVVCKVASAAGKCEPSCSDVVVTAKEKNSGSVIFGTTGVNSDASLTGSACTNDSPCCPGCCSKSGQNSKSAGKFTFLSDVQVQKFMDVIQADPKTNVMMAPKLTMFNGQASTVNVTEPKFFSTNVKTYRQGEQEFVIPQNQTLSTGLKFSVKPTVSADHRFVQMSFEIEETSLDTAPDLMPLFPVTTFIKPINSDGSKGEPKPFTILLQQPSLVTQRVHQEFFVPCGKTALLKTWTRCTQVPEECGLPILSCLPCVGDMFKTVSYHEETADVWIMITPRVVISEEEETRPPVAAAAPTVMDNLQKLQQARVLLDQADHCRRMGQAESARHIYERVRELCPGSRYAQMAARRLQLIQAHPATSSLEALLQTSENGPPVIPGGFFSGGQWMWTGQAKAEECLKVQDCMEKYWQACAEGRLAEATQWAVQALALDPACFSKAHQAGWKKSPQPAVMPSAN